MALDYKKLGFKCGIEIHQQLEGKKLFCDCPANIKDGEPDKKIKRNLRAAAGETGAVDEAAAHEMAKAKDFIYYYYNDSNCLVELDEEPPHEINKEALKTALIVAKLLNARIIDEVQVMRKTVVDGSNTSGFQRTALIATDGYIETSEGKISVPVICLEEEAAKIVERTKNYDVYNLSRLGIPLIEIGTGPDIKSPEGAKEAAEKLGMILRSTKRVKRGLGTIRQDVNLSIAKGARVEVKGFQEIKSMPKVIENEVKRQLSLIEKGQKVNAEVRKAEPDGTTSFLRPMPGADRMYPETDVETIFVKDIKVELPELIDDKAKKIEKFGLSKDLADFIAKKGKVDTFVQFVSKFKNLKPAFIAETMIPKLREIKRKHNVDVEKVTDDDLKKIFEKVNEGSLAKEKIEEVIVDISKGKKPDFSKFKAIDDKEIEAEIKKIVEKNKGASFGALMGECMKKFRGKVDGKKVSEILKRILN